MKPKSAPLPQPPNKFGARGARLEKWYFHSSVRPYARRTDCICETCSNKVTICVWGFIPIRQASQGQERCSD